MTLIDFFKNTDLEKTFAIGYYGGTNFGDELLLEILQNFLAKKRVKIASIYYTDPECFAKYHHNFGFTLVDPKLKINFIKKLICSRSIVIGGGGLWGLDTNTRILILSFILLFLRFVFQKKIHVISVGYYNSTNKIGHLAARITAFAANTLITRDHESFENFRKVSKKVILDNDLSFYLNNLDLKNYEIEANQIVYKYNLNKKVLLVGLRRFDKYSKINFTNEVLSFLSMIKNTNVIIMSFEDTRISKFLLNEVSSDSSEVIISSFNNNPIAFFIALKKKGKNITIIAPQYHVQIVAHLLKIPFLPISYDNKVSELHKILDLNSLPIRQVTATKMEVFSGKN